MKIFSLTNIGLIALENIKKIEDIIPKIIINEEDKDKKGSQLLSNVKLDNLGIGYIIKYGIYMSIIIILVKKEENKVCE